MAKDFHAEPFDAGTIKKLEIFRGYIQKWLPVFLSANRGFSNVAVYDFFAGPGKDAKGVYGSPLIIIEEVKRYLNDTTKSHAIGVNVSLYFNDDEEDKYLELDKAVKAEETSDLFSVEVENKDFGVQPKRSGSDSDMIRTGMKSVLCSKSPVFGGMLADTVYFHRRISAMRNSSLLLRY